MALVVFRAASLTYIMERLRINTHYHVLYRARFVKKLGMVHVACHLLLRSVYKQTKSSNYKQIYKTVS